MKPHSSPQNPEKDQEILQILEEFGSMKAEYPAELLAARRAAFLNEVARSSQDTEVLAPEEEEIVKLLTSFSSIEGEYPSKLLTARRAAFVRQATHMGRIRLWEGLRSAVQNRIARLVKTSSIPSLQWMHPSLSFVVTGLFVVAFVGFLLYGNRDRVTVISPSQNEFSQLGATLPTSTPEGEIICKPGYLPPLCLAKEFEKSQDLIFQGNGSARPAVAKDTIPGYGEIHRAANVNDGLYGPGASWISNSEDSWIKIDLGKVTAINTVAFGRDRLGKFNDRDPGQFVVAVALSDDIYADGNSNNDNLEYTQVYNSEQAGFNGVVSGPETVTAQFGSLVTRFIKITFENEGTAIDEVEVFMVQPPVLIYEPTKKHEVGRSSKTATPIPTHTPLPTDTATWIPTNTPLPTDTATPIPTTTPLPTDTPTRVPTNTPLPTDTATPIPTTTPLPTDTPTRVPTNTPFPMDTPIIVFPTDTIWLPTLPFEP